METKLFCEGFFSKTNANKKRKPKDYENRNQKRGI